MRGLMTEWEPGSWEPGEPGEQKFSVSLRYFRYTHDGEDLVEIDVENAVRMIGGVDQIAEQRAAIGL